jgi:hypothetical protein
MNRKGLLLGLSLCILASIPGSALGSTTVSSGAETEGSTACTTEPREGFVRPEPFQP